MPPPAPLCAVLAGGQSSRMGQPKPLAELAGRHLIDYPIEAARAAGLQTVVVAKAGSPLPPLEVEVVAEPGEPRHPLCGIVAALRHGRGRDIVVVGCDMPFVSADLLTALAALEDRLAVPSVGGRLEPLLARYSPSSSIPWFSRSEPCDPFTGPSPSLNPRCSTTIGFLASGMRPGWSSTSTRQPISPAPNHSSRMARDLSPTRIRLT